MDNANEELISVQDLDDVHTSVFENISRNVEEPNLQWKQLIYIKEKGVQILECQDVALIGFVKPLIRMYYNISIIKIKSTRSKINLHYAGDLIQLSECDGCKIYDEKRKKSHELVLGKKLHLSRKQLSLYINGDCDLYLLWLFKNKEDFEG
ncbi:hypothetical protein GGI35DRAFT_52915 [Trichoderma velutinum]